MGVGAGSGPGTEGTHSSLACWKRPQHLGIKIRLHGGLGPHRPPFLASLKWACYSCSGGFCARQGVCLLHFSKHDVHVFAFHYKKRHSLQELRQTGKYKDPHMPRFLFVFVCKFLF